MMELVKNMLENETEGTLMYDVCEDLLNSVSDSDELEGHIKNILTYGCSSGIVSSQIYYSDTEKFFNRHQDEIFDMYNELHDELGDFMKELNLNSLSWLAYEETTRQIASLLDIEY